MRTWIPDTCQCKIEELYDGPTIIGSGKILYKCSVHINVPNNQLYETIMSENMSKNIVHKLMLEDDLQLSKTLSNGSKQLADDVKYVWLFDADRNLQVSIEGKTLTEQQTSLLQKKCNEQCSKKVFVK